MDEDDTSTLGQPYPIKVSKIDRYEGQPRRHFPEASLVELANSIQQDGQEQPIKVTTKAGEPGRFILIDGERRWRAITIIQTRTGVEQTVDAFIAVVKDRDDHFRKSVISNLFREDLFPADEAAAIARLYNGGVDTSADVVAKTIGKSKGYVRNFLKIATLPDAVKELMNPELGDAALGTTAAIEIAYSSKDPKLQLELAQEVVARRLNLTSTRSLVAQVRDATGNSTGGSCRHVADEYRALTSFIGMVSAKTVRITDSVDIDRVYASLGDEKAARDRDAYMIRRVIQRMHVLLKKVGT